VHKLDAVDATAARIAPVERPEVVILAIAGTAGSLETAAARRARHGQTVAAGG